MTGDTPLGEAMASLPQRTLPAAKHGILALSLNLSQGASLCLDPPCGTANEP